MLAAHALLLAACALAQPPLPGGDDLLANYQLLLDYVAAQANARSGLADGYGVEVTGERIVSTTEGQIKVKLVQAKPSNPEAPVGTTWLRARGQTASVLLCRCSKRATLAWSTELCGASRL